MRGRFQMVTVFSKQLSHLGMSLGIDRILTKNPFAQLPCTLRVTAGEQGPRKSQSGRGQRWGDRQRRAIGPFRLVEATLLSGKIPPSGEKKRVICAFTQSPL